MRENELQLRTVHRTLQELEWPGRGIGHLAQSSAEMKESVEVGSCSPSVTSWHVTG